MADVKNQNGIVGETKARTPQELSTLSANAIKDARVALALAILYNTQAGLHIANLPIMSALGELVDFEDFVSENANTANGDGASA